MNHELKCWPEHFEPLSRGVKTVELRRNDRNYQVGDVLILREWEPMENAYTGRNVHATITHIVSGGEWLNPGYVAMSVRLDALNLSRDFICEGCGKLTPFRINGLCAPCAEGEALG
jgi:hypothetical protein